ncbi:hypothetical protein GCM10022277_34870 [Litoribacillus peritrichatus]|uniref:Uncharacterized protein n=1 Tax=Litoribacillus peritrichatus TaxID=718191 RepID=A0ABP7N2L6_9GAMM
MNPDSNYAEIESSDEHSALVYTDYIQSLERTFHFNPACNFTQTNRSDALICICLRIMN